MNEFFLRFLEHSFIAQLSGFVALFCAAYAFYSKEDKVLKLLIAAQNFFLVIHLLLLGAFSGASVAVITCIRAYVSTKPFFKKFAFVFIIFYTVIFIFVYKTPFDFFPLIGGYLGTYAMFFAHGLRLRILMMLGSTMWLVHNIYFGSIGASLMEAMLISINMWRMTRMAKEKRHKE